MTFRRVAAVACAVLLAAVAPAGAATWSWSYSGGGRGGAGQFTTTDAGSPYTITGISGTFDGAPIDGLTQCCNGPPWNNNLLYVQSTWPALLDSYGFAFSASLVADGINIFFLDGTYMLQDTNNAFVDSGTFTASRVPGPGPDPVPAPAALGLFALALAGLVAARGQARRAMA